jgi:hypothetical protein
MQRLSRDGGAPVTSGLSRRNLFTALPGWLGLSGCYSTSESQNASKLALRISAPGSVDLSSAAEQPIDIPHGSDAKPAIHQVVLVDVIQDDPTVDTSTLRWVPGYPVYDEAASTDAMVRVLIRLAAPTATPATGRARILFEL